MKVVVGLGNPGSKYAETRHNVGWMVLDRLADRAGIGGRGRERDAAVTVRGRVADRDVVLVKPLTYMNDSGIAVRKILARERVQLHDMLIVVDDFALPLGRLRIRPEGTHGGHNGLRSITTELGTQKFSRLRVGIGEPRRNAIDHVLSRFAAEERSRLDAVLDAAADAVETWVRDGADRAANQWNGWSPDGPVPAADGSHGALRSPGRRRDGTAVDREPGETDDTAGDGEAAAAPGLEDSPPSAGSRDRSLPERSRGLPAPGEVDGPPGPDGIRRTRTGWRRILPHVGGEGHGAGRDAG